MCEPIVKDDRLPFHGEDGDAAMLRLAKNGTKLPVAERTFSCLLSGAAIERDYIKSEG